MDDFKVITLSDFRRNERRFDKIRFDGRTNNTSDQEQDQSKQQHFQEDKRLQQKDKPSSNKAIEPHLVQISPEDDALSNSDQPVIYTDKGRLRPLDQKKSRLKGLKA